MDDRLQVLVVDDEPGMRLGIERALRHFTVQLPDVNGEVSFAVESVESGEAAWPGSNPLRRTSYCSITSCRG